MFRNIMVVIGLASVFASFAMPSYAQSATAAPLAESHRNIFDIEAPPQSATAAEKAVFCRTIAVSTEIDLRYDPTYGGDIHHVLTSVEVGGLQRECEQNPEAFWNGILESIA